MEKRKKKFCLIYPFIDNACLTKDLGLITYIMQKYLGYESSIACYKNGEYPHQTEYLENLNINFIENTGDIQEDLYNYILHNEQDVVFLYGFYEFYIKSIIEFKNIYPNGKLYIKLDANLQWMNRLGFQKPFNSDVLKNCDVISVESKKLQEYLCRKWPIKIDYITNGFYDFYKIDEVKYEEKENIILTVGRIGTHQKANEILLEAFNIASDYIQGWKVRFVGNVEKEFYEFAERFINENGLNGRVEFTGSISDKNELEQEYRKAKVFCLTSRYEGFPNVFPEAAKNGCYIISSDIAPAWDITGNQKYGAIFEMENTRELASTLMSICNNEEEIERVFYDAKINAQNNFNWIKICRKIDCLLNL